MPAVTAREYHTSQTHYLRRSVSFNTPGITSATTVEVGTIPANALVLRVGVRIGTAFNAGTTNTLDVGYVGAATAYFSAQAAGSVAVNTATITAANQNPSASAPTPIFVRYNTGGTAASAGEATVWVEFAPFDGI